MHTNAPKDCCSDQVKVLKVHYDQNLPESYISKILLSNAVLPEIKYADFRYHFSAENIKNPENFSPPPGKISFCILFCSFLI